MFARLSITASLALAALLGATTDLSAQNRRQGIDVDLGPIRIGIGDPDIIVYPGPRPYPRPRPQPRPQPAPQPKYVYVVSEYNPITGGLYRSRTFDRQRDAYAYRDQLARAHWVKWRFMGINEPIRYRRFSSSTSAQRFIETDGPSKTGKLGFALLTKETRAVPTRVSISTRRVQN